MLFSGFIAKTLGAFSIVYQRSALCRISHSMEKEFRLEKSLIEERTLPISSYNCSAIKDLLLKLAIKVSVPTIIARVTSDIPDKGQVTIRSSGLYANIHRGMIKKPSLAASTIRIVEDKIGRLLFGDWADMISKVYEVEPLLV